MNDFDQARIRAEVLHEGATHYARRKVCSIINRLDKRTGYAEACKIVLLEVACLLATDDGREASAKFLEHLAKEVRK